MYLSPAIKQDMSAKNPEQIALHVSNQAFRDQKRVMQ